MKKHIVLFLSVSMLCCLLLSGCGSREVIGESERYYTDPPREVTEPTEFVPFEMEHVGVDGGFDYYRDTVTDVLYVVYDDYNGNGFTIMLDPETGLPLTYTHYMEMFDLLAAAQ